METMTRTVRFDQAKGVVVARRGRTTAAADAGVRARSEVELRRRRNCSRVMLLDSLTSRSEYIT